jgi:hypothetical protein
VNAFVGRVSVSCATCGMTFHVKPYRADTAKFCSRACKGIAARVNRTKPCEVCGKPIKCLPSSLDKKRYCSYECTGRAKERKVLWTCQSCGLQRMKIPSYAALVCRACDREFKSTDPAHVNKVCAAMHTPEAEAAKVAGMLATNAVNPHTGKFETNHSAKDWHLRSPHGDVYHFRNLRHFIREHRHLFSPAQLRLQPSTVRAGSVADPRTVIGGRLSRLSPRNKHPQTTAQGWSWVAWPCEPDPRLITANAEHEPRRGTSRSAPCSCSVTP